MAVFPPLAHAQQRVVAGLRQELAQIPHLKMAALLVSANLAKHAKHKLVTVAKVLSKLSILQFLFVYIHVYCSLFQDASNVLVKALIEGLVAGLLTRLVGHADSMVWTHSCNLLLAVRSCEWRFFLLWPMLSNVWWRDSDKNLHKSRT